MTFRASVAVSAMLLTGTTVSATAPSPAVAADQPTPFSSLDPRIPKPPPQATGAGRPSPAKGPQASGPGAAALRAPEDPTARVREVVESRTELSETYVQANGGYQTVIANGPIHYRDAKGELQKPDNTLVADSSPGYALQNKANAYRAQLPSNLGSAPVRMSAGADWVTVALQGAKGRPGALRSSRAPAAAENRAIAPATTNQTDYAGALPGVDVSYSAENWASRTP